MAHDPSYDSERFHFSLWPPIACFASVTILLALGALLTLQGLRGFAGSIPFTIYIALLTGGLYAGLTLIMAVFNRLVPTRVGPQGIHTYNGMGIPIRVPWDQITGVSRMTLFPGFTFLWLHHGKNFLTAAYLAAFMSKPQDFYDALVRDAGPVHALTKAFQRYV